ncbi:MAG: hypothetical protein KC731_04160 [Myxococcales bacterium]|nr:hypothetical protein [Myxococcales bacterium]
MRSLLLRALWVSGVLVGCGAAPPSRAVHDRTRPPSAADAAVEVPPPRDCDAPPRPSTDAKAAALVMHGVVGKLGDAFVLQATAWPGPRSVVGFHQGGRVTRVLDAPEVDFDHETGRLLIKGPTSSIYTAPDVDPVVLQTPAGGRLGRTFFTADGVVGEVGAQLVAFRSDGAVRSTRDIGFEPYELELRGGAIMARDRDAERYFDITTLVPFEGGGPLLVGRDRVAQLHETDDQGEAAELVIRDRRTGKELLRRAIRMPRQSYRPGAYAMHFSHDGRHFFWLADHLYVLSLATGQIEKTAVVDAGYLDVGITADRSRACLLLSHDNLTVDVRSGRAISSHQRRYVDCELAGGSAFVLDVPLGPTEQVEAQTLRDMSFLLSPHGEQAAFAVSDSADSEAITVVLVDARSSRVRQRLRLAAQRSHGAVLTYARAGTFDVAYRSPQGEDVTTRITFADGSQKVVKQTQEEVVDPGAGQDEGPESLGIEPRAVEVAGSTVLFTTHRTHAFRLERPREALALEGCAGQLSLDGSHVLCERGETMAVHRLEDGKRTEHARPAWAGYGPSYQKAAVSGEGRVALAKDNHLAFSDGSRWLERELAGEGAVEEIAWTRDDRAVLLRGGSTLFYFPVADERPRWQRTFQDRDILEVAPRGGFVRIGRAVFDAEGEQVTKPLPTFALPSLRQDPLELPPEEPAFATTWPRRRGFWSVTSGRDILIAKDGVVTVHDGRRGATIATLLPTARGALAVFADGRVDGLGDGALEVSGLICLRGTEASRWATCASALHDPGALRRHFDCR